MEAQDTINSNPESPPPGQQDSYPSGGASAPEPAAQPAATAPVMPSTTPQKAPRSLLEMARAEVVELSTQCRFQAVKFGSMNLVVKEVSGADFEEAAFIPMERAADGSLIVPVPISQLRQTRRLLMAATFVADSNGGTVGRLWPATKEAEDELMGMGFKHPLVVALTEAYKLVNKDPEVSQAEAKKP